MRLENFRDGLNVEDVVPGFVEGCPHGPFQDDCMLVPISPIPVGLQCSTCLPRLLDYALNEASLLKQLNLSWCDAPADHAWLLAEFCGEVWRPKPCRRHIQVATRSDVFLLSPHEALHFRFSVASRGEGYLSGWHHGMQNTHLELEMRAFFFEQESNGLVQVDRDRPDASRLSHKGRPQGIPLPARRRDKCLVFLSHGRGRQGATD